MKRTVPLLFICCTVLATAAGFLLPGFLSAAQDRSIQTKEYACETDSIQFHPVAQMEDSLQLLSGGHATISSFSKDGAKDGGKLGADGAHRAALEAFRFLQTNGVPGIVSDGYSTHIETPFLAVSSDESKSAVIWECEFYHDTGYMVSVSILIDDNSGKMLAFRITAGHGTILGKEGGNNTKRTLAYLPKVMCLYFGWKYGKIHMNNESKGTITLVDPSGKTLTFPFQISDSIFTFSGAPLFMKTGG